MSINTIEKIVMTISCARAEQGLTLRRLADMAGVSYVALHLWEQGKKIPTIESADKVLKALGVTVTIGKE
jgi:transcriptional regulator with XRE-family HTH domain